MGYKYQGKAFISNKTDRVRLVSGATSVTITDEVLRCDTTAGLVDIYLFEIPEDWDTTYKLSILDYGTDGTDGIASVNNIWLYAPTGTKINGLDEINLRHNRVSCIITIIDDKNYHADISAGEGLDTYIEVTHTQLTDLISSSGLTEGSFYLITDYQTIYIQPDYQADMNPKAVDSSMIKTGSTEPILILATSTSTVSKNAWSTTYPKDILEFEVDSEELFTGYFTKGKITRRVDEFHNDIPFDFREVKFKRYLKKYGTVQDRDDSNFNGGTNYVDGTNISTSGGTGTGLTVNISTSAGVIPFWYYISINNGGEGYTVGDIITITQVGSDNNATFTVSQVVPDKYLSYFDTTFGFEEQYLFNDTLANNSNNLIKGNYHYQNNFNIWSINTVFQNGAVDNQIDSESRNNTFLYTEGSKFGQYLWNNYFGGSYGDTIGYYCYDNFFEFGIQYNTIGAYCNNNDIIYMEYTTIGEDFGGNTITDYVGNSSFGDYCYSNNITSIYGSRMGTEFSTNTIIDSVYDIFENEFEGNSFSDNSYTNHFGARIQGNTFGNNFWYNRLGDDIGAKPSFFNPFGRPNVFGDNCWYNEFGFNIYDNTFGDNFQHNKIGNYVEYNSFSADTNNNVIGNYFNTNTISSGMINNRIGNYFERNTIGIDMGNNVIGNYFRDNTFGDYFGGTFKDYSGGNDIKHNFEFNTVGDNFLSNTIGDLCQYNTFNSDVLRNTIATNFNNNILSADTQGESGFIENKILGTFYNNTINHDFKANTFYDEFSGVNIPLSGFQRNYVYCSSTGISFSASTSGSSVYQSYTCEIIQRQDGTPRLRYMDNTDAINVINVYE